jgi:hypothetical protein
VSPSASQKKVMFVIFGDRFESENMKDVNLIAYQILKLNTHWNCMLVIGGNDSNN